MTKLFIIKFCSLIFILLIISCEKRLIFDDLIGILWKKINFLMILRT